LQEHLHVVLLLLLQHRKNTRSVGKEERKAFGGL
jgi:hypothetical protein